MFNNLQLDEHKFSDRLITVLDKIILGIDFLVLKPANFLLTASVDMQSWPSVRTVFSKQLRETLFKYLVTDTSLSEILTVDYLKRAFQKWLWKQLASLGLIILLGLIYVVHIAILRLTGNDVLANIVVGALFLFSIIFGQILEHQTLARRIGYPSLEMVTSEEEVTDIWDRLKRLLVDQSVQVKTTEFVRVLNANFADPSDISQTLPLDRSLAADRDYELRVDVGLLWQDNPSLFYKDKLAAFPEEAVGNILTEEDKARGAFTLDVVFASEDFNPRIATGRIQVLAESLQRSRPYIDGEIAPEPGWLSLRVRTPEIPDQNQTTITFAYGRLSVYYRNNLLQSGSIRVGVSQEAGLPLAEENSGEIDYVLSYDFNDVDDSLAIRELTFGDDPTATKEYPVALNITLNSNGNDTHHFLVNSYNDDENLDYPATYHQFSEGALSDTLTRIRAALRESTESTTSNKDRAQFIEEIKLLAYYGSNLKSIFYSASEPETEDHRSVVVPKWQSDLKRLLERRRVIQVARTKNADYAFPWAMVYDYDMDRPPGEKDGKKEEYKIEYKYCKSLLNWPQDTIWKNAQAEDRCPYHDKIDHSYGENNRNFLCLYGFWGLKHIIEQPMQKYSPPENDAGNKIGNILKVTKVNKKISLGIAVTDELKEESLAKRKIHLKNLGQSKTINVTPISPARTTSAALQLLHQPDLIYFLCHGKLDKDTKGKIITPLISIGSGQSPDYWIYPAFDRYLGSFNIDHWLQNRPIIFINGCHTADIEPFIPLSFVKSFGDYGANAVIGTEIPVAPGPAMDVAELILLEIANCRMSIGDIVRNMRWEMAKKGSLIGLAYTPYCLADLHTQFKE